MDRRLRAIALGVLVVRAGVGAGVWVQLSRSGPRPLVEVIVPEAQVKVGTSVVATARQGERLAVYGRKTGWYQVRAGGRLGWVYAAQIRRVRPPDAAPRLVETEVLGVYFPKDVLGEFPRRGERWVLVEVQALAAKANAVGGTAIDTDRFVLLRGKARFFRPRVWKSIPVGDHTVDRLELGDAFTLPVGQTRKLRLAYSIPSDVVSRVGWHVVYVPPKPGGGSPAPRSGDAAG